MNDKSTEVADKHIEELEGMIASLVGEVAEHRDRADKLEAGNRRYRNALREMTRALERVSIVLAEFQTIAGGE